MPFDRSSTPSDPAIPSDNLEYRGRPDPACGQPGGHPAGLQLPGRRWWTNFSMKNCTRPRWISNVGQEHPERLHVRYNARRPVIRAVACSFSCIDDHGQFSWSSEQSPQRSSCPTSAAGIWNPETLGEHRIICRQVDLPAGHTMTLRVGCWLGRAQRTWGASPRSCWRSVLFLLLIAPLGGYLLACRATRLSPTSSASPNGCIRPSSTKRLPIRGTSDELDQLSQTINDFLDRIAAYLRQSREFTANAAHELRSPLDRAAKLAGDRPQRRSHHGGIQGSAVGTAGRMRTDARSGQSTAASWRKETPAGYGFIRRRCAWIRSSPALWKCFRRWRKPPTWS